MYQNKNKQCKVGVLQINPKLGLKVDFATHNFILAVCSHLWICMGGSGGKSGGVRKYFDVEKVGIEKEF